MEKADNILKKAMKKFMDEYINNIYKMQFI